MWIRHDTVRQNVLVIRQAFRMFAPNATTALVVMHDTAL